MANRDYKDDLLEELQFFHDGIRYSVKGDEHLAISHFHEIRSFGERARLENVQDLQQVKKTIYLDDGTVAVYLKTFDDERMFVYAPPEVTGEEEPEEEGEEQLLVINDKVVIPMIRLFDAPQGNHLGYAVYYTGKLEAGKCAFLEWDNEADTDDLGVNYEKLALLLDKKRNPGSDFGGVCKPMYNRSTDDCYYAVEDFEDMGLSPCDVEFQCVGSNFANDLPNLAGVSGIGGMADMNAYYNENSDCDSDPWNDSSASIITGDWTYRMSEGSYSTVEIKNYAGEVLATSEASMVLSDENVYEPVYWLFVHPPAVTTQQCWNFCDNESYDDSKAGQYRACHCPPLNYQGYWPQFSFFGDNNHISHEPTSSWLIRPWYGNYKKYYRESSISNHLAGGYGYWDLYDPECLIYFTVRYGVSGHIVTDDISVSSYSCESTFISGDIPYLEPEEYELNHSLQWAVSGTLKINDDQVVGGYSYSIGDAGELTVGYSTGYGTIFIRDGLGSVFHDMKTWKNDKEGTYYESAYFGDAYVFAQDAQDINDVNHIRTGCIAFRATENNEGEISHLAFPNISEEAQALWQDYWANGIWPSITVDNKGYYLCLGAKTNRNTYKPELSYIGSLSANYERFVVRYTLSESVMKEK